MFSLPKKFFNYLLVVFFLIIVIDIILFLYFFISSTKPAKITLPEVSLKEGRGEIDKNKKGNIKLVSEVHGYRLLINNQEKLDRFLNEVGFWQKDAVAEIRHPNVIFSAETLEIKLTSQIEDSWWWRQTTPEGSPVVAINTEIDDDGKIARILLFLRNEELHDKERASRRLDIPFLLGFYGLVPKMREDIEQCQGSDKTLEERIKKIKEKYGVYREILKIVED